MIKAVFHCLEDGAILPSPNPPRKENIEVMNVVRCGESLKNTNRKVAKASDTTKIITKIMRFHLNALKARSSSFALMSSIAVICSSVIFSAKLSAADINLCSPVTDMRKLDTTPSSSGGIGVLARGADRTMNCKDRPGDRCSSFHHLVHLLTQTFIYSREGFY